MNKRILDKILDTLSTLAKGVDDSSAKIAAAIVYKNRTIALGVNQMKSHPFQAKYGKNGDSIFMHAEISVIKDALKILSFSEMNDATLVVCRIKRPSAQSKDFVYGMAKPCPGCTRAIVDFGIKKVIYTTDDGGIEYL